MRGKGIKQQLLAGREKMFSKQDNFSLGSLILVIVFLISGAVFASEQPPAGVKVIDAPDLKVGDTWAYTRKEGYNLKAAKEDKGEKVTVVVESITDKEIVVAVRRGDAESWWKQTWDRQWNIIRHPDRNPDHQFREYSPSNIRLVFPLYEGKKWKAKFDGKSAVWEGSYEVKGRVVGWEKVTVPAGTFDALKIVNKVSWRGSRSDRPGHPGFDGEGESVHWYAPEVKRFVKSTWEFLEARVDASPMARMQYGFSRGDIMELIEYKPKQ